MNPQFAVINVQTAGAPPVLVEVGIIIIDGCTLQSIQSYSTLLRPTASGLKSESGKITAGMLESAPSAASIASTLVRLLFAVVYLFS